jgi:biotin-(acetyl-CoA carboxylase) ligase
VGVGVNCNSSISDALRNEATSLSQELGKHLEIPELRHSILDSFSQLHQRWQVGEDMMPMWKAHVATLGKSVSIKLKTEENPFSYSVRGVDSEGNLIVARDGQTRVLRVEDLEWLRVQA